jgi:hypothetical protein
MDLEDEWENTCGCWEKSIGKDTLWAGRMWFEFPINNRARQGQADSASLEASGQHSLHAMMAAHNVPRATVTPAPSAHKQVGHNARPGWWWRVPCPSQDAQPARASFRPFCSCRAWSTTPCTGAATRRCARPILRRPRLLGLRRAELSLRLLP